MQATLSYYYFMVYMMYFSYFVYICLCLVTRMVHFVGYQKYIIHQICTLE